MTRDYILVFAGGGIGALARYVLSGAVYRFLPSDFPYGTLFVNILGCFAIGFFMTLLEDRFIIVPSLRIFLSIGILGGFTTFSSFSSETVALLRDAEVLLASFNIATNVFGCLCATIIGIFIGRFV